MRLLLIILSSLLPCGAEEALSYAAFQNEGGAYPAFGVSHRGSLCIVTALHPGDGGKAASFSLPKGQQFSSAQAKTYQQPGTSVYIFGKKEFTQAVPYDPEFQLKAKDRLVAVSPEGKRIEGFLLYNPANGSDYSSDMGPLSLTVITDDKTMENIAAPGWPVFSVGSGKVVGTVVVRRSVVKPHNPVELPGQFLFEPLCLPTGKKPEPQMMNAYGGLPFDKPVVRDVFRWLLPDCLWDLEVGMSREALEQKRGKLGSFRENFSDHSFQLRADTPICYEVQYHPGPDKESRGRIVEIELEGTAKSSLGEYPKAEKLVSALEQVFGKPRLFTSSFDPTGNANTRFIGHWLCGERSLTLRLSYYPPDVSAQIVIGEAKTNTLFNGVHKVHKMGQAPASMVVAYKSWLADLKAK